MEKESETIQSEVNKFDIEKLLNTNYNTSPEMKALSHRISVAPMIDVTNVHFRFFMRLLTKHATLYTEMIHENAVLNNKSGYKDFLKFHPVEHPVIIQIGGNNPETLAKAAMICEEMGYDEININIGCPSERVQHGAFGACLMKEPELVGDCLLAMKKAVKIPVTIKTRLGVDDLDTYEFAHDFIKYTSEKAELDHYVIHARKAYLKGLNPSENRNIPPLHYDRVLKLKTDLPHLEFSINGGFKTMESIQEILSPDKKLKGCMIGRLCYENPWLLADVDRLFYGQKNLGYSRREILEIWAEYSQKVLDDKQEKSHFVLVKPIINLFTNEKGNTKYRQLIGDHSRYKEVQNFRELVHNAIKMMDQINPAALDARPPLDDPKYPK